MDSSESMKKYELVIIVDAKLNQEDKDAILKETTDAITKSGGKLINSQVWLEKHKLTFEIKKCKEATYYLINYEAGGNVNDALKAALKLNERVLRSAISKVEKLASEPIKG